MPANLTPEFLKAREQFHAAQTPQEKLIALEEMLTTIPKHKGTDKMQADIKRRIAKLRDSRLPKKHGKSAAFDHIAREGAGQVVLIGSPNSGKSSLLAALTNAHPEIANYPYSTIIPVIGMMNFEDVPIQLIDLPPITLEYTEPWVYNLIRQSDLALFLLDGSAPGNLTSVIEEILFLLEERHIQLAESTSEEEETRVKVVPCRIVLTKGDLADHR
ncbi:50S ribosome-binding GTPase, partial [Candidatus Bipolaricaulota bacterium]|nr:50S ribosome-binding GTPase [Candidatus Bipolaricaulota bacterium]